MHGIVMNQFRQYVVDRLGRDAWVPLAEAAGVPVENHRLEGVYPDEQLVALVLAASRATARPLNVLLEDFGAFIAPALLRVYAPLVNPAWRTLDVIEHTEQTIHTVVRARMPGAAPPALLAQRVSPTEVHIDYRSERGLCSLAEGIARGMALHFGEEVDVSQPECAHRGGARCLIIVRTA
ncbi:MAG TPA: heme NO-binding domain-containing protein [Longimicrobium sp.]